MVGTNPVGHESAVRGSCEKGVHAQRKDVSVRVGIAFRCVSIRSFRRRDGPLIVRMVGVIVSWMPMTVVLANLMRVLHLNSQIRASHVNERDGDDQQTLENGSHVFSLSLWICASANIRMAGAN